MASLDDLINEEFGACPMKDLSKVDDSVQDFISTGNYALDYACSKRFINGGIPMARITGLIGLSSVGKSLLTANFNKDPRISKTIIFESEGGGNSKSLYEFTDSPFEKVRVIPVRTFTSMRINKETGAIEEISEKEIPSKLETDKYFYERGLISYVKGILHKMEYNHVQDKVLIIIDSLSNIKSVRQLAGGYDMGMSGQNRNDFFSSIDGLIEKTNATLVFTNKMYNAMDPYAGVGGYVASGGASIDYNPSLNITLTAMADTEDWSDADKKNEKERRTTALGSARRAVRGRITKSRFGTFSRNATFLMDANYGIVPVSGLREMLEDFGVCQRSGNKFVIPEVPGLDKPFAKKDFPEIFMANKDEYLVKLQEIMNRKEKEIEQKAKAGLNTDTAAEDDDEDNSMLDVARAMEAEMSRD